jgi:hypothetical protein
MGKEDLEKWLCESIRFTGFFVGDVAALPQRGWIEAATGLQPTTRVEQSEMILEDLKLEPGVKLSIQLQPFRIDLALTVDIQAPKIIDKIQTIGDPITCLNLFMQYMKGVSLIPLFPDFNRIALGISNLRAFTDIRAAYGFAKQLLPTVKIDPENASDLMYRINRPREIEIGGSKYRIHRLTTWSVFEVLTFVASLPPVGRAMSSSKTPAIRVDLDINTFQDSVGLITPQHLLTGLEAMSANAFHILVEGDTP